MLKIRGWYALPTLTDLARRRKPRPGGLPRLWLMTDERRLPDPAAAIRALPRGAGVIFRHYGDPDRASRARQLARLCRSHGLLLLVAGDAGLAAAVGAAGLHLPEVMAWKIAGWRRRRPRWLITAAAHGAPALRRTAAPDAILLSPLFATESHAGDRPLGIARFAALARRSPVPVYALGGITAASLPRLNGLSLAGVAAIGALAKQKT